MFDNISKQTLADALKAMIGRDNRVTGDERAAARARIGGFERASYHPAVMTAAWTAAAPGQILVSVEGERVELRYFAPPDGGSSAAAVDRVLTAYESLYREQVAPPRPLQYDEVFGTAEAAEYAHLSEQAIKWNYRQNRLVGKLVGSSLVFTKAALDAFLALPPAPTGRPRAGAKRAAVDDQSE